jgi:carbonic anhydrase
VRILLEGILNHYTPLEIVMDGTLKSKGASGAKDERVAPQKPQVDSLKKGGPMSAEQVLNILMEGNQRFVERKPIQHDVYARMAGTQDGQDPMAVIIGCSDSRVDPVTIFNTNPIGDLFKVMNAGNLAVDIALDSIYYPSAHLKPKVIMVLGHTSCGAVTGAHDDNKEEGLRHLMATIKPAIEGVERTGDKKTDVDRCAAANVKATLQYIADNNPTIKEGVKKGEIKLVGAMYHLDDGHVEVIEEMKMAA